MAGNKRTNSVQEVQCGSEETSAALAFDELADMIPPLLRKRRWVLLMGPPGVGKTALGQAVASAMDADYVAMEMTAASRTDVGPTPVLVKTASGKRIAMHPVGVMGILTNPQRRTVVLFDDVGTAPDGVHASLVAWFDALGGRVGPFTLSPDVYLMAATNRKSDKGAGARKLNERLMGQLFASFEVRADMRSFMRYAVSAKRNIHPLVCAYLRSNPERLHEPAADVFSGFPCPRSWESAGHLISQFGGPSLEQLRGVAGIGMESAVAVLREMCRRLLGDTVGSDFVQYIAEVAAALDRKVERSTLRPEIRLGCSVLQAKSAAEYARLLGVGGTDTARSRTAGEMLGSTKQARSR